MSRHSLEAVECKIPSSRRPQRRRPSEQTELVSFDFLLLAASVRLDLEVKADASVSAFSDAVVGQPSLPSLRGGTEDRRQHCSIKDFVSNHHCFEEERSRSRLSCCKVLPVTCFQSLLRRCMGTLEISELFMQYFMISSCMLVRTCLLKNRRWSRFVC